MKKISEITAPITPQKVANAMGAWVAIDKCGMWYAYERRPHFSGKAWVSDIFVYSLEAIDIQWEGDWRDSLHAPEPEILPGPDGEYPRIQQYAGGWRAGVGFFYVGDLETKAQVIRAWNAVVRSLTDDA
jgi:hypothetical protein